MCKITLVLPVNNALFDYLLLFGHSVFISILSFEPMADSADKSTREIKQLLLKLNPNAEGGHNARVKAMDKFKQYVSGGSSSRAKAKGSTPAFYDDDITFLFLGEKSEFDDEEDEDESNLHGEFYGLLKACASPSTDYTDGLKRSARNAMILLKYLVCDFVEISNGKATNKFDLFGQHNTNDIEDLNQFAQRFCVLTVEQLKTAKFDVHIKSAQYNSSEGNKRNGAKDEACELMVFLLNRHMNIDGTVRQPIDVKELLPSPQALNSFETWLQQKQIMPMLFPTDNKLADLLSDTPSKGGNKDKVQPKVQASKKVVLNPFDEEEEEEEEEDEGEDQDQEQDDTVLPDSLHGNRKAINQRTQSRDSAEQSDDIFTEGPSTWANSDLAIAQAASDGNAVARFRYSRHDSNLLQGMEQRMISRKQRELEEDPLGIKSPKEFNLNQIDEKKRLILEQAIRELDQDVKELEEQYNHHIKHEEFDVAEQIEEQLLVQEMQLAHLEALFRGNTRTAQEDVDTKMTATVDNDESKIAIDAKSIITAEPSFDPLLFLTLIHKNASPEQLRDGLNRLNDKRVEQARKTQTIIKDKIDLFVQCAKGINIYSEDLVNPQSNKSALAVRERIDSFDILASTCSDIALRSFYKLLENTKQVQKVQATLAVLKRIGPLLQVPSSMKKDIENGRFSSAIKLYRQTLSIHDDEKMELLRLIRTNAIAAAQDARRLLEDKIASPTTPVHELLDAVRDLSELVEVALPNNEDSHISSNPESSMNSPSFGKITVGTTIIDLRANPPSISCFLLQATLFDNVAQTAIAKNEDDIVRVFAGESFSAVTGFAMPRDYYDSGSNDEQAHIVLSDDNKKIRNRLVDAIVELRVMAIFRAVSIARSWLPRLADLANGVREFEKRQEALSSRRKKGNDVESSSSRSAIEVYYSHIAPSIGMIVDQISFMVLGNHSPGQENDNKELEREGRLPGALRNALPPLKLSKCAPELSYLFDTLNSTYSSSVRPNDRFYQAKGRSVTESQDFTEEAALMGKYIEKARSALIEVERRHCRHVFDICARNCAIKASGSGFIDGNLIVSCLSKLLQDLTVPLECCTEILDGVNDVIDKCCYGLSDYVTGSNRDDQALLRAISSCALMLSEKIPSIHREVVLLLTSDSSGAYDKASTLEKTITEKIGRCESDMFDIFMDNIRQNIAYYTKLGPLDLSSYDDDEMNDDHLRKDGTFPAYLSSSLLAIVRYRAMVEKILAPVVVRKADGEPYQSLTLYTASDSLLSSFCKELRSRFPRMALSHADKLLNELQFLVQTLRKYLSENVLLEAEECKRILMSKAGSSGKGPNGLGAIERLERLGRMYVLCLSSGNEKYEL